MDERLDGIRDARARGEILKLVRTRHRAQQSRMDHVELWHMLRGIGIDIGENDVLTCLQDLGSMDMIEFEEDRDRRTNRIAVVKIQLCARGLRVLEHKLKTDMILL